MKSNNGISRKMDVLGRVCIPIEMRKKCNMHPGDYIEMSISNNTVQLKRYFDADQRLSVLNKLLTLMSSAVNANIFLFDGEEIVAGSAPLSQWGEWREYLRNLAADSLGDNELRKVYGGKILVRQINNDLLAVVRSENEFNENQSEILNNYFSTICDITNLLPL